MRALLPVLIGLLLLSGCEDALGIGATCSREMREVRRAEGQPDRFHREERAGNFTEVWHYDTGGAPRVYVFRWGAAYDSCQVEGPVALYEAF